MSEERGVYLTGDQLQDEMRGTLESLVRRKVEHIMANRERIVEAFIAETGLRPSEIEQVEERSEDGRTVRYYVRKRAPEWISVKDRLPERGVEVLVWLNGWFLYFLASVGYNQNKEARWYGKDGLQSQVRDLDYWQPLPAPPESEG
jgi:hypothetical protein